MSLLLEAAAAGGMSPFSLFNTTAAPPGRTEAASLDLSVFVAFNFSKLPLVTNQHGC
jgi:hypothetical protein